MSLFTSAYALDDRSAQAKRLADLRSQLKSQSVYEVIESEKDASSTLPPPKRHLTDQEKADLRKQLRQQRPDGKSDKP